MSQPITFESTTRVSRRRVWSFLPALLLTIAATLLAIAPRLVPNPAALVIALVLVFLFPGYLLEKIIAPTPREISLTRLPPFFVLSLTVWAIPATALQLLSSDWFTFRIVFVVVLWGLTLLAFVRGFRATNTRPALTTKEIWIELALAALCVLVAFIANGPRDADDWMYLQVAQQILGSNHFQILAASEPRYSIRYAFHVWIFLQAFLGQWLNVDLVTLARDWLPVLLAPLALISFYAWSQTFFGRATAALVAVLVQLAIYVTFANADGWGRGFFARSAQDKFLVWLVILPVALTFAWGLLRNGKLSAGLMYGAALIAGLWVHPVTIFLVLLTLGGFALFNLISRTPLPRRRWLLLLLLSVPSLLVPLVIRKTTLPIVFTVNTPDVLANVRISEGRLLFQPPFYIADPALIATPLVLVSLVLLVLFTPRVRHDTHIQFLGGSTLIPLALLFNPFTARVLGEMLTPWQLWRMTWNLPAAFIWTATLLELPSIIRQRTTFSPRTAIRVGALALVVLAALWLSNLNTARAMGLLSRGHALEPPVEDMLRTIQRTLDQPAMILLPRDLTRYASAYTFNAVVMSNDAQKEEDELGQQIDRFYDTKADPKFLNGFLNYWKIEYAVVPNDSLQDLYLRTRPDTQMLYRNTTLTLYKTTP
ncbi:MAG TPA: DUF6077 domain-containing protein [Anaerolineae bacterium]|nr:DUF6077 domain-containing protein [Anaerolineae bacterium]